MRSFEERKAEIFRRSGERIAKRKKRIRTFCAVCLPIICLVFICAPLMIYNYPDGSTEREGIYAAGSDTASEEPLSPEGDPENAEPVYFVDLSTGESFSGNEAKRIAEKLEAIFSKDEADVPENEVRSPESAADVYTIKIVRPDGSEISYVLEGNTLGKSEGCSVDLTPSELSVLKEMLGLS